MQDSVSSYGSIRYSDYIIHIVLLFYEFILCIHFSNAIQLSSITPCAYPNVHDRAHCGILDPLMKHGSSLICDPDNVISMSEVHLVDSFLQRVYNERKHKCICNNKSKGQHCWYKFGFAFVREIFPVDGAVNDLYNRENCPMNRSLVQLAQYTTEKPMNSDDFDSYAHNFARIIRERWDFSSCGEDILILVVLQRPTQFVSQTVPQSLPPHGAPFVNRLPIIFVSYGSQVAERFGLVDDGFHSVPYNLDPMQKNVNEINERLQNGYPLQRVLNDLIHRLVEVLDKSDKYRISIPPKDHIPTWAWIAFASCGALCVFMGIGLCLIQNRNRRGHQRSKTSVDPARRWKAGFAGEDANALNQQGATTYVNLVQMMMPPHRSTYASPNTGGGQF